MKFPSISWISQIIARCPNKAEISVQLQMLSDAKMHYGVIFFLRLTQQIPVTFPQFTPAVFERCSDFSQKTSSNIFHGLFAEYNRVTSVCKRSGVFRIWNNTCSTEYRKKMKLSDKPFSRKHKANRLLLNSFFLFSEYMVTWCQPTRVRQHVDFGTGESTISVLIHRQPWNGFKRWSEEMRYQ